MKIAVCVKHVPDGRLRVDPATKRLDRSGAGELNKVDTNAVEEALQLRGDGEGEVVIISMGPPEAVESLRTALALGADRAVLVSDPGCWVRPAGDQPDPGRGAGRESPDLTFFGQQTARRRRRPALGRHRRPAPTPRRLPGGGADGHGGVVPWSASPSSATT